MQEYWKLQNLGRILGTYTDILSTNSARQLCQFTREEGEDTPVYPFISVSNFYR